MVREGEGRLILGVGGAVGIAITSGSTTVRHAASVDRVDFANTRGRIKR